MSESKTAAYVVPTKPSDETETKVLPPCLWCPEDALICTCNDELACGIENPTTCESCT